jgi:hypothetical protein
VLCVLTVCVQAGFGEVVEVGHVIFRFEANSGGVATIAGIGVND